MTDFEERENIMSRTCCQHPMQTAEWICQTCDVLFCDECVIHKKVGKFTAHICPLPQCRGRCVPFDVNQATGSVEAAGREKEPKKEKKPLEKFEPRRYLTRYYIALAFPSLALISYDVLVAVQGRSPLWWIVVAWAGLIFLMSGRYFWAYVMVTGISGMYTLLCFHRIYSHQFYANDNMLLNKICLGFWILTLIFLLYSYSEFSD